MSAGDMSAMSMADMDMAPEAWHAKGSGSPQHENSGICSFAAAATSMALGRAALAMAIVPALLQRFDLPQLPFVPHDTILPTRLPRGPPSLG